MAVVNAAEFFGRTSIPPEQRTPEHQARLRAVAETGTDLLVQALGEHRLPGEWARFGRCRSDTPVRLSTRTLPVHALFFPQPDGDWLNPDDNMLREHARPERIRAAKALCTGWVHLGTISKYMPGPGARIWLADCDPTGFDGQPGDWWVNAVKDPWQVWGPKGTPCPVYADCLGWTMSVGGGDKDSIGAGTTWKQRKQMLARIRRRVSWRPPVRAVRLWRNPQPPAVQPVLFTVAAIDREARLRRHRSRRERPWQQLELVETTAA